ncbi:tripartite tricarboxylate transporter TctB family protein [Stappia indica]|uniref:tripartite tricarboxylate transporter TctB family protein n=1 Tax=Stappia indica TaxID=538381 RepID=UPI001CD79559|nr:tripartite tricarboxylate transporter TctB family protein [Stappia indica]MCA1298094.1 tripartite tricarboxylate transporter TctB family protein [Stappia indica]
MKTLKDAGGGLLIAAIGLLFLLGAREMPVGSLRNMGPGMVPTALSVVAIFAGLAIAALEALRNAKAAMTLDLRALVCVGGAIALYAVLMESAGLLATTVIAVFLLAAAPQRFRPVETLLVGVGLSVFTWAVFVKGLGMPLSFLPDLSS